MGLGELEFKASDGHYDSARDEVFISISDANRLLRERLEKAPEVFHYKNPQRHTTGWRFKPHKYDTHRALLWNVAPLERRQAEPDVQPVGEGE